MIKKLQQIGAKVYFYNERPSNSMITKGLIRVDKRFLQRKIKAYYKTILEKTKNEHYDFFLLIKGESIPHFFLKEIKKNHPKMKMIYYNYDSFIEYPHLLDLLPFFDKKKSFDSIDCEKHHLEFQPLFYIDNYIQPNSNQKSIYDVSFIGSIHSDRYVVAKKINKILESKGLTSYLYLYAPSRLTVWLKKLFDKNFKTFNIKELSFKSLSENDILDIYKNSNTILDICKPFQNGLTMRTFEAMAMQKKLITTNKNVSNYPFYSPKNILIIDRGDIQIPSEFFDEPYQPIDEKISANYSLESWLKSIFSF